MSYQKGSGFNARTLFAIKTAKGEWLPVSVDQFRGQWTGQIIGSKIPFPGGESYITGIEGKIVKHPVGMLGLVDGMGVKDSKGKIYVMRDGSFYPKGADTELKPRHFDAAIRRGLKVVWKV